MEHWLYNGNEPFTKREAWIHLLLCVNHKDNEVPIGNKVYVCKRGQSIRSLKTYAKDFNWTKSKVNRFFELLKNQNMIEIEGLPKTTRLTICNYDTYQGHRNTDETPIFKNQNTNTTDATPNKNVKNAKEEKKVNGVNSQKNKNDDELYTDF